jgi:general secretion pathway protein K
MMKRHYCQQGIALITVMLVLAIATVAVVSMSTARQMDIRRTENQLRTTQAWEYVYGLESWAQHGLQIDGKNNKIDSLADRWTNPLPRVLLVQGTMQGGIEDLQGRINLNNLLVEGEVSEPDINRLKRLLVNLNMKPELVDAMLDWIDKDMEIRYPHGAEDETYTRFKPAYRSSNHLFTDVSELLLVQGMTLEQYQLLRPYVYVADAYAPININTASTTVLRCLADDISADQAESMFRAQGKPFEKITDFLEDEAVAETGIGKYGLDVISNHFLVVGQIDMGKTHLMFESQLQRNKDGQVKLVKRQRKGIMHG